MRLSFSFAETSLAVVGGTVSGYCTRVLYSRVFAKNTSASRYLGTCALNVNSDDSNNQWQLQ